MVETSGSERVSGSRIFLANGVYVIALEVEDGDFDAESDQYVIVYDPSEGLWMQRFPRVMLSSSSTLEI